MKKNKLCFATGGVNPLSSVITIELRQQGRDLFSVRYGLQIKTGLNYAAAATELGAAIMHLQACDGLLDNRDAPYARV